MKVGRGQGHNVLGHLLSALNEDVSITSQGKTTKAKAGEVLARRLVKQGLYGSLSEQVKLVTFLRAYGELDPEKMRNEIQEEYAQALQKEQHRYSDLLGDFVESVALMRELLSRRELVTDAFIGAKSKCSCDAFVGYQAAEQAILKWSQDDDYDEPDDADQKASEDPEDPFIDDLSAGMIGND